MINYIEKETIVALITVNNTITEKLMRLLRDFDLTIAQFNILRILRGQKGTPVSLATIHERMIAKMSNTTRLVDRLVKKGLVDRKICPHNRRKVDIIITKKGLEILCQLDPILYENDQDFLKNLSIEEIKILKNLLHKI